jgi:LmbE family N-acetylglucosaminyl deacetylase
MKIIAIGAHRDDIELACGGTLAKAIRKGHQVKCIIMSQSAYKNYDGTVLRTEEEANTEGDNALRLLGINDFVVLDFSNKNIPYNGSTVEAIDKILVEYKPDLILTHWTFDTHQDHMNTALASISAARYFNSILMYEPFPPSGRSYHPYRPQVYIDVSDDFEIKKKSIEAHKSQHKKYGASWIESVEGRARMRGNECGVKYAESFELVRYNMDI